MLLLSLLLACSGKDGTDDTAETGDSADSGETADSGDSGETGDTGETDSGDSGDSGETADTADAKMPPDPRPLTLQVSGSYTGSLTFDAPTCAWYDGVPNFRAFWRNAAQDHVFVLVAEILGPFDGPGTYDQTMTTTRVKLQEEAGGSGHYFGTDTAAGDTVSIRIDAVSESGAWGEFTFNALHGEGSVEATPQPIPIWCPVMN